MPKPPKGPRLGSGPAHERLLLAGLAADLIRHERIRTTEAKAKRLRPVADRLITLGKNGSVHARRQALSVVRDREVVHKLFAEVAPRYTERMGGYTRILKLGVRKGDAAPMALIEWVEGEAVAVVSEPEERRRLAGRLRRRGKEAEAEKPVRSARRRTGTQETPGEPGEPGKGESETAPSSALPAASANPTEAAAAAAAAAGEAGEAPAGAAEADEAPASAAAEAEEAPAGEQEKPEE